METVEPKKIMKIVLYTRVSSEEQIQNYSLETQLKACEEYCRRQEWEIVERFQEEGESAKSADRTELLKLIDYCSRNKGNIDIVLVHKLDRFARNSADHHAIRAILAKNGVAVRSVSEQIDDTPAGKFMENIFAATAQWDNDVRSERAKNGLKEKAMQGYWAWGAPLGYLNTPTGLAIDKEKAPLVIRMFKIYSQGNETIKGLTVKVNKLGLRNKHGKKLYAQTVTRMLQNKLYMGTISVPRWNYEGESLEPKLIEPELFYRCEAVRNRKVLVTAPRLIKNPDFPLKSIAYCKPCGNFLTGSYSRGRNDRYPYYHCAKCNKTRVPKKDLEYAFIRTLKEIQPNGQLRKLFKETLIDVAKQKLVDKLNIQQKVSKQIDMLKERKTALIDRNLRGILGDEDLKEAMQVVNSDIVLKEIERSENRDQEVNLDHTVALAENILSNVALLWFEAQFEQRLRFQTLVFPKGIFYKDGNIGTDTLGLPFALIQDQTITKTTLVPRTGVEPVISGMKARCPRPLDERGKPSDYILTAAAFPTGV